MRFRPTRPKAFLIDSLGLLMELSTDTVLQISNLVNTVKSTLNIEKLSIQQQNGTFDCGLFAIAFALESCLNQNSIQDVSFDQKQMRNHLLSCFEKGKISPFPKIQKCIPRPNHHVMKINVYCLCRLPDIFYFNMIKCDFCSKWFHYRCISVPVDLKKSWKCIRCYSQ